MRRKRRRERRKSTGSSSTSDDEDEVREDLNKSNQKKEPVEVGRDTEMAELKMKNLKLVKIQENLEGKIHALTEEIKSFKDIQSASEKTECELLVAKNKVEQLEIELSSMKESAAADREDNRRLHKMLLEQQSVIKTAMVRIFPKKQNSQENDSFCQEHLKTIKAYEERSLVHRH